MPSQRSTGPTPRLDLAAYDIDTERGFVPAPDPLRALPEPFTAWDNAAAELPLAVMAQRSAAMLRGLPVLDVKALRGRAELRRALLLLTGFANAYMAAPGVVEAGKVTIIPRGIAVPLVSVARALNMPAISTHATVVLGNWRRIDPAGPLGLDNVDTLLTFRGSIDERWFFLSTLGVELVGAPVLADLVSASELSRDGSDADLTRCLEKIAARIELISAAFMRVREACDPYIFYNHVRPFLAGWPTPGAIYEGTDLGTADAPAQLSGASAAQSSLLQAIDAALGIVHGHTLTKGFLGDMRDYMPPQHRAFIAALGEATQIRARALATTSPALRAAYDAGIAGMDSLRRRHIGIVAQYITKQMPPNASAVGTGGTSFDDFLRQARVETVESKVGEDGRGRS